MDNSMPNDQNNIRNEVYMLTLVESDLLHLLLLLLMDNLRPKSSDKQNDHENDLDFDLSRSELPRMVLTTSEMNSTYHNQSELRYYMCIYS